MKVIVNVLRKWACMDCEDIFYAPKVGNYAECPTCKNWSVEVFKNTTGVQKWENS